jgi:hypothetical protein
MILLIIPKIGEYHTKQEVLAAVDKDKQERKSRAR